MVNEYSEYMQYLNQHAYPPSSTNATSQQAFAYLTDPINGTGFSGCNPPNLYYDYVNNAQRWSNELRLQSKENGRFHWLAGLRHSMHSITYRIALGPHRAASRGSSCYSSLFGNSSASA